MIVKNEEAVIARCLDCVKQFADEIIVVDTGSSDTTKDIVKKYTDKLYDFKWCEDFSKARNYAFSLATLDYVMWLDADDVIEYNEIEKINQLKLNLVADTYMLKYATSFDETGKPVFQFERERIMRNCNRAKWQGFVHEAIAPFGKVESVDITIQHRKIASKYSRRNLNLFRKALKCGVKFSAREQYYYARELFYWRYYKKAILELKKFLRYNNKFLPNTLDAMLMLAKCEKYLNNIANAKKWLYELIDVFPISEAMCELGVIYEKEDDDKAIFWYESALNVEKASVKGMFVREEYYYLIPLLELARLNYNLGNYNKAKTYHIKALMKYPHDKRVQYNKQFFEEGAK